MYTHFDFIRRGMKPLANIVLPSLERSAEITAMRRDALQTFHYWRKRGARFTTGGTGTFSECPPCLFNSTAYNTSTSETSLLTGQKVQPCLALPSMSMWVGKIYRFEGWGICGSTSTPTITFKTYLNTTQGVGTLGGTSLASTAAIAMASSVSNKLWNFWLELGVGVPGTGSGNCTLYVGGAVQSGAGFTTSAPYTLGPSGGDGSTVSVTLDGSQVQWFNISGTWSASSASNTIQLVYFKGPISLN